MRGTEAGHESRFELCTGEAREGLKNTRTESQTCMENLERGGKHPPG